MTNQQRLLIFLRGYADFQYACINRVFRGLEYGVTPQDHLEYLAGQFRMILADAARALEKIEKYSPIDREVTL